MSDMARVRCPEALFFTQKVSEFCVDEPLDLIPFSCIRYITTMVLKS